MAKVSAHGSIIGTIEYLTYSKRYMSDGVGLKNIGFGWKIHGKVKQGLTPEQAFENASQNARTFRDARPAYCAYRAALHDLAGVGKRWKLHQCVELMPHDPDGVWSEACDGYGDNIHADIDEVSDLCRLYRVSIEESKALKASKETI